MTLIHAILVGLGLLIALYLGVKNANGVGSVFSSGGSALVNETKALQGR